MAGAVIGILAYKEAGRIGAEPQNLAAIQMLCRGEFAHRNTDTPNWVQQLIPARRAGASRIVPRLYVFRRLRAIRGWPDLLTLLFMLFALLLDLWTAWGAKRFCPGTARAPTGTKYGNDRRS